MARKKSGDGAGQRTHMRPAPSDLPDDEQRAKCREAALRLLQFRERTVAELRGRLHEKRFSGWIIEEILARLVETGLLNDERFAGQFATSAALRGSAPRRVQMELRRRGVDKEPAARAATASPEEEEQRAEVIATRRAGQLARLPGEVARRRLAGFLARRGYPPDLVRRVVDRVLGSGSDRFAEPQRSLSEDEAPDSP